MTTPDSKLTVRTATQEFRVRRRTVRRLLRDGSVIGAEPVGSGREWLIPRQSLERLGLEPRATPASGARRWPLAAAAAVAAVIAILVVAIAVTSDDDSTVAATPENAASTSPAGEPDGADVDSTSTTSAPSTTSPSTTSTSTTVAPLPIGPPAPPSTTESPDPSTAPEPVPTPTPADSGDSGDSPNTDGQGTHEVVAGDNLWAIASHELQAQDPDASEADVFQYWQAVIDANADQLIEAGNPDLILPGQQITLPSTSIVGGPVAASP